MRGFMKVAGVVRSCRRCHSLRKPEEPSCPACLARGVVSHFTDAHVLMDTSDDLPSLSHETDMLLLGALGTPNPTDC